MMSEKRKVKVLLVSDFNSNNLAGYLRSFDGGFDMTVHVAPYGQVHQTLIGDSAGMWSWGPDAAVVWTRPEAVIPGFAEKSAFRNVSAQEILDQVDAYSVTLRKVANRASVILLPTWALPVHFRGYGMLDMKHGFGVSNILARMNLRLAENLASESNIYLLDSSRWLAKAGERDFSPKLWYAAKIPFGNDVFKEAVADLCSALGGVLGMAKKLIVVDLDDTLWGGVVGDLGWEHIRLGGHDPLGEAFVSFQQSLKALSNRGVILGIASKNDESVALEAIDKHPEMILRRDDFAGWEINWQDKAANIASLVENLNLGLQSAVFIDDNPVERSRVREALPDVYVPDWPEDETEYARRLMSLRCFDTPSISAEDVSRVRAYASARRRDKEKANFASVDEWLSSLQTKVTVELLNDANLERTTQLLNKTNQMNLSTRRMTATEFRAWSCEDENWVFTFRVSDKFANNGLTGIASLAIEENVARLVDFVVSCRVMGRKVEETMVSYLVDFVRSLGLPGITANYVATARNKPCLTFWKRSGFTTNVAVDTFTWDARQAYARPPQVILRVKVEGEPRRIKSEFGLDEAHVDNTPPKSNP